MQIDNNWDTARSLKTKIHLQGSSLYGLVHSLAYDYGKQYYFSINPRTKAEGLKVDDKRADW